MPSNVEALRLIREAFSASEMTQSELARASEIPRSTLANMLSPTATNRVVHVAQMIQIAVALDVDARTWVAELQALERKRLGRARAPQVQKRAARSKPKK